MKRILLLLFMLSPLLLVAQENTPQRPVELVRPMMGTTNNGYVAPVAAAPFGMVELCPDTFFSASGYLYEHSYIYGFSHTHKSGMGGTDFQDIMFFPLTDPAWLDSGSCPDRVASRFSHDKEYVEPGYYRVSLLDTNIEAELTATQCCGMHRYNYPEGGGRQVIIDLRHGSEHACTIIPEEDFDTVRLSHIKLINKRTICGYRITNGWAPEQHAYFYAEFSEPIVGCKIFSCDSLLEGATSADGTKLKMVLDFGEADRAVVARVGISPVSCEGARKNLKAEIRTWDFDEVRRATYSLWNDTLSAIEIGDATTPQKEVFYTCLYFAHLYPQLYSDVTGHYRSSDSKVYKGRFNYYGGVFSPWDTFRTQIPLMNILHPEVTNDLVKTMLEHYRHCGQLPIWLLAGVETMCMIGYNSMPVIADAYSKGIRDYDAEAVFEAMKASANRDTFGYFLRDFRGARYYNQYGYVPCDKEITSVSKTLEYCYADWCIAQMARMLGRDDDYKLYIERAARYKNLFDKSINFMRGRLSDGSWRTPFDPFYSNHYQPDDDFCEGTSWQWSFFVPHDIAGLAELYGGEDIFAEKLDSLFTVSSELHGPNPAPDITGRIGQYAHGNEPGHHTLYIYNYIGQPWKGQKRISDVLYTLYSTKPYGMCGNDDGGQMSAWYVMSAMGFYPMTHGQGVYCIGSPMFKELKLKHRNGTLTILAPNASRENCYVQSVTLNGKPYNRNWLAHDEIFSGDNTLCFDMGAEPNLSWGVAPEARPQSMLHELTH
ncbi:MAG: GH92 family glycosyl hydrolase [Alistipes sp.]|nr:GH92 family glycosyl hydrolase [Alistipes sp.]